MDQKTFDEMTRAVMAGGGTRRALFRLLAGGALGGVATRLGLKEEAEAKEKKQKSKQKQRRASQPERKARGRLQAEGKRKGKKGKNKPKEPRPSPLPPGCRSCNECQLCQDGACLSDPALEGVRCLGSGANCGYCQSGQCTASVLRPCEDGVCPLRGQCCPGERQCPPDPDPMGGGIRACVDPETMCCPGERRCAGGSCVPLRACCPNEWECLDGTCVPQDQCCQTERRCPDGSCVSAGACCGNETLCPGAGCSPEETCGVGCCPEDKVCCGGECVNADCPPGQELDPTTCECTCSGGRERCPDGSCCDGECTPYTCCPADRDYCLGTCCTPGTRCMVNGRHGICCQARNTHDCYIDGVWRGCYDPTRCYCDPLYGVRCP